MPESAIVMLSIDALVVLKLLFKPVTVLKGVNKTVKKGNKNMTEVIKMVYYHRFSTAF